MVVYDKYNIVFRNAYNRYTVIFVLISRGGESLSEYILPILPIVVWRLLQYVVHGSELISWGYESLLNIAPMILGCFLVRKSDYKVKKYFCIVLLLSFLITAITTIIGLQRYPDASRYLALAESYDDAFIRYSFMNIGGYDFVYSAILLYPLAIYAYKNGKMSLWLFIVIFFTLLVLILNAGYTTALILFSVSSVLMFLKRNLSVKNILFVIIISTILMIIFSNVISKLLNDLANVIENKDISERLRDLSNGTEGIEQGEDNRIYYYRLSLKVFLGDPIFGRMFGKLYGGGHSFILDSLAEYGLVGGAIILYIYVTVYKNFFKQHRKEKGFGYILWSFMQVILLSALNPGMWLYVLCLYIPIIVSYLTADNEENFSQEIIKRRETKYGVF